ncbi:MAG TPA: peptidoglycan bridge formation glycyltransferase FemA/FemB family protein [Herpetosiphonaceae bacterium]|nr:peptidoglycan bridge formation glycyltransferase FemA/FemB family protein [Herpetosiphonaceae bacterium]
MHVQRFDNLDPASPAGMAWEALVRGNPASGLMQSLHWAGFKRARGLRVLHLGLFSGEALIGGCIFYGPEASHDSSLLIAPGGPVLDWSDQAQARQGLRLLRADAEQLAAEYGAVGLRIEPQLERPRPAMLRDWGRAPVDQLAGETLYLDIAQDEAAILAQMKPKGRYNIGLSARRGVTVRESTDPADIPALYALMDEAGERDGFYVEPIDHFSDLLAHLSAAGLARMLFAEYQGATLGALLLVTYGARATYLYGGTANIQRNVMAGYALQWAAIRAARAAGCAIYDFYGFERTGDPNHQYANFSRFKRAFGGTPLSFIGAHDFYWPDRLADAIIRAVGESTR